MAAPHEISKRRALHHGVLPVRRRPGLLAAARLAPALVISTADRPPRSVHPLRSSLGNRRQKSVFAAGKSKSCSNACSTTGVEKYGTNGPPGRRVFYDGPGVRRTNMRGLSLSVRRSSTLAGLRIGSPPLQVRLWPGALAAKLSLGPAAGIFPPAMLRRALHPLESTGWR